MRTARSRIAEEYLFDLFITPFSQEMESSINPGRVKELLRLFYNRVKSGAGHWH